MVYAGASGSYMVTSMRNRDYGDILFKVFSLFFADFNRRYVNSDWYCDGMGWDMGWDGMFSYFIFLLRINNVMDIKRVHGKFKLHVIERFRNNVFVQNTWY